MAENKITYEDARKLRQAGFSNILATKLLSDADINSSLKTSLSISTVASLIGLKETFDPLNIAKVLTGGSSLGPALLGRMLGRNMEDLEYFSGNKKKKYSKSSDTSKVSQKKNSPFYLYTVNRGTQPIRVNDSLAVCLNKLFNLIKIHNDRKLLVEDIKGDFQKEREFEEKVRQKKLDAKVRREKNKLKSQVKRKDRVDKKKEAKTFVDKLKEFLSTGAKKFGSVVGDIAKTAKSVVTSPITLGAVGLGVTGFGLSRLLKKGEAATYNTVYGGLEIPLDKMTVDEVIQYQRGMSKSSAVGKYQMIRKTLEGAKKELRLTGNERFNKETQDYIYNEYLIGTKRQNVRDYLSGKSNDIDSAALDMAKEFASFPVPYDTKNDKGTFIKKGESFYKDRAGNKSLMTVDQVYSALQEERDIRTGKKKIGESSEIQTASISTANQNAQTSVPNDTTTIDIGQTQSEKPKQQTKTMYAPETVQRNTGERIASVSSDNTDIKKEKKSQSIRPVYNNTNNYIIHSVSNAPILPVSDDSPVYLRND